MTYEARNYSMGNDGGRKVRFEASNHSEAKTIAERLLPGKHGQAMGGRKGAIIGIKVVK